MLSALSVGYALPEKRSVRTQPDLFRFISEYATIDPDRLHIPKSLMEMFEAMMTSCGRFGIWEWQGSKMDFEQYLIEPRPNEERVECGRDVLILLRSLPRYCTENDGVCRIHGMTVICMAFEGIEEEISYGLQGDYVHVKADQDFADYVNVSLDVWFKGPDAAAAWRSSYEFVEVKSDYNVLSSKAVAPGGRSTGPQPGSKKRA